MISIQQISHKDIYAKLARKLRIPIKDVTSLGNEIFNEIEAALLTRHEVKLPFGTFQLIFQAPEYHRNVRAQKVVHYGPGFITEFKCTTAFRNKLRGEKQDIDDPDMYFNLVETRSRVKPDLVLEEDIDEVLD